MPPPPHTPNCPTWIPPPPTPTCPTRTPPPPTDPPEPPPPKPLLDPPPIRPSLTHPPPIPPPPQGASGQQLVGGVVGVQNRGVAPPGGAGYATLQRVKKELGP